jgi:branched-chain amino acid transport system ATP-binding protein
MTALMSLNNVSKNFGGLAVITDVSFDVPAGSRMALIGPNGAGENDDLQPDIRRLPAIGR